MWCKVIAIVSLAVCLAACGSTRNSSSLNTSASDANTTVSAQTANNTSAADNFPSQQNGNLGANNVSKVNVHSLLYSGATTKVLAQLLLWFGQPEHMNVGYN